MGFGEVLREFGVKVSLNFDPKKFEQAQDKVEKLKGKLQSFAFELAGATAGVFEFQNLFTANARSLQNQADLLGINTTELQEYEYAAKVAANVNRDELVSSLQELGNTMDKARAGDLAARQALEQIGGASGDTSMILSRLNDKTYKVTDAMRDMSKGISAISKSSPQAASRLTEMTLGNAKLFNLMRQGPAAIDKLTEEGKRNFALNEKMIKQGYLVDIQMSKLWMIFRKFGYEIGYNVMRHLMPMIKEFEKWFQVNKKIIASDINAYIDVLADTLKEIYVGAQWLFKTFHDFANSVGGTKEALKLMVEALLAFKAIEMGVAIAQMITAFAGLGIAMAPVLATVTGLASLAAIIHDLWSVLSGGRLEDTWLGQLGNYMDKLTGGKLNIGDKIYDWLHPAGAGADINPNSPYGTIQPAGAAAMASSTSSAFNQENHFSSTMNVSVPVGTPASVAASMLSKANVDSHEKLMIKAKQDAARSRKY